MSLGVMILSLHEQTYWTDPWLVDNMFFCIGTCQHIPCPPESFIVDAENPTICRSLSMEFPHGCKMAFGSNSTILPLTFFHWLIVIKLWLICNAYTHIFPLFLDHLKCSSFNQRSHTTYHTTYHDVFVIPWYLPYITDIAIHLDMV